MTAPAVELPVLGSIHWNWCGVFETGEGFYGEVLSTSPTGIEYCNYRWLQSSGWMSPPWAFEAVVGYKSGCDQSRSNATG